MKKPYTNADFGKDLKKSFEKGSKKKKMSMPKFGNGVRAFGGPKAAGNPTAASFAAKAQGQNLPQGGTTQAQMNSAQANAKVLMKRNKKSKAKSSKKKVSGKKRKFSGFDNEKGTSAFDNNKDLGYMHTSTPALSEGQMANMKIKSSKKKGTKKKVSHVLQESSMCKACETSHKPGKHSVKKKS